MSGQDLGSPANPIDPRRGTPWERRRFRSNAALVGVVICVIHAVLAQFFPPVALIESPLLGLVIALLTYQFLRRAARIPLLLAALVFLAVSLVVAHVYSPFAPLSVVIGPLVGVVAASFVGGVLLLMQSVLQRRSARP